MLQGKGKSYGVDLNIFRVARNGPYGEGGRG